MTPKPVKIVRLTSTNIKRLSAVTIEPGNDTLVTVAGPNESGKSSVLDSISYVFGGEKLIPSQPIRRGETKGEVVADIGDLIVTRKFFRDEIFPCDCEQGASVGDKTSHASDCIIHTTPSTFGPTKSRLEVTNRDGAKYPSPQVMLDQLYGKLSFDPLAYAAAKPAVQNEILRQLAGLNFSELDEKRKTAFGMRAMHRKTLTLAESQLRSLPKHDAVPEIQSVSEVTQELERGMALDREAAAREADLDTFKATDKKLTETHKTVTDNIAALEQKLIQLRDEQAALVVAIAGHDSAWALARTAATEARAIVPDLSLFNRRVKEIDIANTATYQKQRENAAYETQAKRVKELEGMWEDENKKVIALDEEKASTLEKAQFPIPGLGLSDDGVTFEGLPLEEVSASVQLRVSVAIGLALNPTLKVLLIRNGNLLDDKKLKLVAEQAAEAGAQVWMEYVVSAGDNTDGMTVVLEDGHLA